MHRVMYSLGAAWSILVLAGSVSLAQSLYTLEYKFEKGKTYRFGDSTVVNMVQEMMGQEMKTSSSVETTTKLLPTDITPEKGAVLEVSSEAMRIVMKTPQMDTTIVPSELIGKRTRITVSKLGEVSRRQVIDTIKATGFMRGVSQREAIRFHSFPSKPVSIGEKWKASHADTTEAMGGSMVTVSNFEYTFVSKEQRAGRETLKLTYSGTMKITGKGTMMGNQLYIEGSGKARGTCYVDPATGLPVYDESTSDMATTAALTGQQNMTIPSSQNVVSRRTLLSD